jgi:redox-sensitive bicupin YhaK (pirin superfamily)
MTHTNGLHLSTPESTITGKDPETGDPAAWTRRPSADRFLTQLSWLHSRHSFSFGHHHDPAWEHFGPLLVINDDIIQPGNGFGLHPHRDMEIITVMVEGMLEHRDSLGNGEVLRAGEVQRMSAGTGITHSEWNPGQEPCRLLQIWIEPLRRGLAPSYSQQRLQPGSAWTPLIDPDGASMALAIARPVRVWRAQPRRGEQLPVALGQESLGWLQLIDGAVSPEGTGSQHQPSDPLRQGDGLGFAAGSLQRLEILENSDLLLMELT